MKDDPFIERSVIEAVSKSEQKAEPIDILRQVSTTVGLQRAPEIREAIRSLVDRGDLQMTLDWKLSIAKG